MRNDNKLGIHTPNWEQLPFAPATGIGGTNIVDDGFRYIYVYFQTSTTASAFWRFDTWGDCWQQLATAPTSTGTVANMVFTKTSGGQWAGKVFGSIFLFVGNGSVCYLYRYNIATNAWSANLGTTNVPAAFATDAYLMSPGPSRNGWEGGFHSGVLRTITSSSSAAVGATSIAVTALPEALAAATCLRFGTFDITFSSAAAKGATSLAVSALPQSLAAETAITLPNGYEVYLSAAASAGATTLSVYPISKEIASGTVAVFEQFAVLTASAALSATSITVSPLLSSIPSAATALYYGNLYLIGSNAAVMYRYNKGANAWYTTSANSGNPAIPALPGAAGVGCALKWLPAYKPDKLWCLRGVATSSIYVYDLVANTWATETYYPGTESFGTGTHVATRSINGKQSSLLIQKDTTMRIYEVIPATHRLEAKMHQWLYPTSTAVVGDRSCCITMPDGVEFYYALLHSTTAFLRTMLIDQ